MQIKGKKISGKFIFNAVILTCSVGLLVYFCVSEDGLIDLIQKSGGFQKEWLVLGVCATLGDLVFDTILIRMFTNIADKGYSMRHAFKCCMVGHFYSAITPFQTGGQPMQVYLMSKQGVDIGVATSSMTQKFLVYQSCLTIYSLIALIIGFQLFAGALSGWFLGIAIIGFLVQIAVILGLILVSFHRSLTHRLLMWSYKWLHRFHIVKGGEETVQSIEKQLVYFHECNQDLYKNKPLLIKAVLCTFLQQTSLFLVSYCVYRAFGFTDASPVSMVCAQAFVTMVSSMVPLPGASGASEGSFFVFLSMFFTPATIKSGILLWRTFSYYFVILISAPFAFITKRTGRKPPEAPSSETGEPETSA